MDNANSRVASRLKMKNKKWIFFHTRGGGVWPKPPFKKVWKKGVFWCFCSVLPVFLPFLTTKFLQIFHTLGGGGSPGGVEQINTFYFCFLRLPLDPNRGSDLISKNKKKFWCTVTYNAGAARITNFYSVFQDLLYLYFYYERWKSN